ncbi:MAG: YHS domain-containing (seleno)protein [Myxococcota bacterium]
MRSIGFGFLVAGLLLVGGDADAAQPLVFQADGAAIHGYDPVAYFTKSKPVRGSKSHTAEWSGATWRFASAKNRELFQADPEKYAPQFGGWCAYAMSFGRKATTVPEAWAIVDGKLYLNYSLDIQKKWNLDRAVFIKKAHAAWPKAKDS